MAIDKHRSPTLTNAFGTPEHLAVFPGLPGGPTAALAADADRRHLHRSGASGVERRQQRRLHRARRRVPARERHRPAGSRAVRQAGDLADGRPDPELHRAHADGDAPGPGHGARSAGQAAWDRDNARLKVEVLRGATTATSTVIKSFQTDDDVVEPTAARLRRHHRAARARARPTASGSPIRPATGRRARPRPRRSRPERPRRVDRTPRACSPTTRTGCGASARRAARRPTTGRAPNDLTLNSANTPQHRRARC